MSPKYWQIIGRMGKWLRGKWDEVSWKRAWVARAVNRNTRRNIFLLIYLILISYCYMHKPAFRDPEGRNKSIQGINMCTGWVKIIYWGFRSNANIFVLLSRKPHIEDLIWSAVNHGSVLDLFLKAQQWNVKNEECLWAYAEPLLSPLIYICQTSWIGGRESNSQAGNQMDTESFLLQIQKQSHTSWTVE